MPRDQETPAAEDGRRGSGGTLARAVSLLLSAALAAGLMLLPALRARELTPAGHGLLTPLLLAVCGGFVHGLGFRPRMRWLDLLLRPALLWPAMLVLAVAWWRVG